MEDLNHKLNQLKKHNHLLREIIAKVPGFVFWKDMDLKLMGCNDNFARQVGLKSSQSIIGLTDHDLPWTKEQTKKFIQDDQEILKTGIPKSNIEEIQRQLDGQDLCLLTSKVPLFDGEAMVGLLGIYVDITPLKTIEQALRIEKERAETANQLKTDFMLNMQHDIRTPLTGIYGMAELLANKKWPGEIKAALTEMMQAAKELLDYCHDVLDFAHVEYGSRPVLQQPFSLKKLLHSVLNMQKSAARLKKLRLSLRISENTPDIILGDAYRTQRILINLISNAVKFTEKGQVKIIIRANKEISKTRGQIIQFSIQDTGVGIPPDKVDLIYEKFMRVTRSNKGLYRGSGLGLYMVKQYVGELKGNIYVKSQIDRGTTFKVLLPVSLPLSSHIME